MDIALDSHILPHVQLICVALYFVGKALLVVDVPVYEMCVDCVERAT